MSAFYAATVEMGVAERGHDVHQLRLRAGLSLQRRGHRPRLGELPVRAGRRGAGRRLLRRTGRRCALGGPDDSGNLGRFIPTVAVDQYAATLATWYGLPAGDVAAVFPNIGHFDTPDLGFFV